MVMGDKNFQPQKSLNVAVRITEIRSQLNCFVVVFQVVNVEIKWVGGTWWWAVLYAKSFSFQTKPQLRLKLGLWLVLKGYSFTYTHTNTDIVIGAIPIPIPAEDSYRYQYKCRYQVPIPTVHIGIGLYISQYIGTISNLVVTIGIMNNSERKFGGRENRYPKLWKTIANNSCEQ